MQNKSFVFFIVFWVSAQVFAGAATNPSNRFDVDNNGEVNEFDARLIIKAVASNNGRGPIAAFSEYTIAKKFLDVNGDGFVDPVDALQVINEIEFKRSRAENAGCNPNNITTTLNQFGLRGFDFSTVDHKGRRVEASFNGTINFVKRYNVDGTTIDTSFGNQGYAGSPDFPTIHAIDVTQDNKILLVGSKHVQGKNEKGPMIIKYQVTILLRLNENGTIDTTFNPQGHFDKPLPLQDNFPSKPGFVYHPLYAPKIYQGTRQDVYQFITGLHIYADGTIVVIGNAHFANTDPFFSVYRHTGEHVQFQRFTHIGYAAPNLTNLSNDSPDVGEAFRWLQRDADCQATVTGVAAVWEQGSRAKQFNLMLRLIQDPVSKLIGLDPSIGEAGFVFSPHTR